MQTAPSSQFWCLCVLVCVDPRCGLLELFHADPKCKSREIRRMKSEGSAPCFVWRWVSLQLCLGLKTSHPCHFAVRSKPLLSSEGTGIGSFQSQTKLSTCSTSSRAGLLSDGQRGFHTTFFHFILPSAIKKVKDEHRDWCLQRCYEHRRTYRQNLETYSTAKHTCRWFTNHAHRTLNLRWHHPGRMWRFTQPFIAPLIH